MSIKDFLSYTSQNPEKTAILASTLASSLYDPQTLIRLQGELGSGKTTFTQGLARGLGIQGHIASPTFALEQRYDDKLLHMDLYRLDERATHDVLRGSEDFSGLRVVEWPERASWDEEKAIDVTITPLSERARRIEIAFNDIAIPDDARIDQWMQEADVLPNIRAHMELVTDCVQKACDALLQKSIVIRPRALRAAAKLHDLLRFLDFPAGNTEDRPAWNIWRKRFSKNHEIAVTEFLRQEGFYEIGMMIRTHGAPRTNDDVPHTIEQKVLNYCDKRVLHDRLVSLDERFDDFHVRSRTSTPEFLEKWRIQTKKIETELFGDSPPF